MYSYHLPAVVMAGQGALDGLPELCAGASRAVLLTDRGVAESGLTDAPAEALRRAGVEVTVLSDIPSEPTCDQVENVISACLDRDPEIIIGFGGGSVMDTAKLASVCSRETGVRSLLRDVSGARKHRKMIAVPTTAGTGSEATPNAIVAVPEEQLKVGIVSGEMIPDAVILDGACTRRLPAKIAASTGIDALCHAIECFTSRKATPFSDLFALEALKLIFAHLEQACLEPEASDSRDAMLLAAFYGGAAIACSGTTAVHALSYPLGGRYHIPHGISNAIMLMPVMKFNLEACEERFAAVCDALGEAAGKSAGEKAEWLLNRMEEMVRRVGIPTSLESFGVSRRDLEELTAAGMKVQRLLQNNLRTVTEEDARKLYLEVLPAEGEKSR